MALIVLEIAVVLLNRELNDGSVKQFPVMHPFVEFKGFHGQKLEI